MRWNMDTYRDWSGCSAHNASRFPHRILKSLLRIFAIWHLDTVIWRFFNGFVIADVRGIHTHAPKPLWEAILVFFNGHVKTAVRGMHGHVLKQLTEDILMF